MKNQYLVSLLFIAALATLCGVGAAQQCPPAKEAQGISLPAAFNNIQSTDVSRINSAIVVGKNQRGQLVYVSGPAADIGFFRDEAGAIVAKVDDRGTKQWFNYDAAGLEIESCLEYPDGRTTRKFTFFDSNKKILNKKILLHASLKGSSTLTDAAQLLGVTLDELDAAKTVVVRDPTEMFGGSSTVSNNLASVSIKESTSDRRLFQTTTRFSGREVKVAISKTAEGWRFDDSMNGWRIVRFDPQGQPKYVADQFGTVLTTTEDEFGRITQLQVGPYMQVQYEYHGESTYWATKRVVDLRDDSTVLQLDNPREGKGTSPFPIKAEPFRTAGLTLPGVGDIAMWDEMYDRRFMVVRSGAVQYALLPLDGASQSSSVINTTQIIAESGTEGIDWDRHGVVLHLDAGLGQEVRLIVSRRDSSRPEKTSISLCGDCICVEWGPGSSSSSKTVGTGVEVHCPDVGADGGGGGEVGIL